MKDQADVLITSAWFVFVIDFYYIAYSSQNPKPMSIEREQSLDRQMNTQRIAIIVLAILLILSVIGNIVYISRSSKLGDENDQLMAERAQLQQLSAQLGETIEAREADIERLHAQMAEMESDHEASIAEKDGRIASLNRRATTNSRELEAEKAAHQELAEKHEALTAQFEELGQEHQLLEEALAALQHTHEQLLAQSQLADELKVYNICMLTKWERWICADRYNVSEARRVNTTFLSFEVDGSLFTSPGDRDVHLVIYSPDGNIMYPSGERFTKTTTGEESAYTMKQTINYANEPVQVEFTVIHPDRLQPGTYMVEVYVDGTISRSSEMVLE